MRRYAVTLVAVFVLAGCSKVRSPSATVKQAFLDCNEGRYSEAAKLLSKELIAAMQQSGGVKALCDMNTGNGSIKDIHIDGVSIRGEGAVVTLDFTYQNGTTLKNFESPVVKEDGEWKVALKTY